MPATAPPTLRDRSKTSHARSKGKPTPTYRDHQPARSPMVGNLERLEDKMRMAHELKARGYYNYEVADAVAKRFGCARPDATTVSNWLAAHRKAADEDIRHFINEARLFHFKLLQEQLRKWHEIACPDAPSPMGQRENVKRADSVQNGETMDQQMRAAVLCVKIMERQARLLGLDLPSPEAQGKLSPWEQMHYIEKMTREVKVTSEGMQWGDGEVLELRSGIPGLNDLNHSSSPAGED